MRARRRRSQRLRSSKRVTCLRKSTRLLRFSATAVSVGGPNSARAGAADVSNESVSAGRGSKSFLIPGSLNLNGMILDFCGTTSSWSSSFERSHGKFGLASLGRTVAGWRLTLPSASQRLVQLDGGGELVPRGRGEVQLRAEELALGIEHLELRGQSTFVAESDQRERPPGRPHAALTPRAELPHLAMEDEGVLDFAERLLDRLQILCGRLLLACLEALDRVADPPRREEGNGHGGTDRPKP